MIRWLDFNDTFTAAQGSHPSDNLGGILAAADALSRERAASRKPPLAMRDVLHALIMAYEIQGCIAIENDFNAMGIDHPMLSRVAVDFELLDLVADHRAGVRCTATVEVTGKTGVEMEALTAVQIGLLTIYDMCKAVDRGMTITDVRLLEKHGGKSGSFVAKK